MCPPLIGTLSETKDQLHAYKHGLLFQQIIHMDVKENDEGIEETKGIFHEHVMQIETRMNELGWSDVLGLIGGNCILCQPCKAVEEKPCPFPERARPSLEAMGVDVVALLGHFNLETAFYPDRITWTGTVLFNH